MNYDQANHLKGLLLIVDQELEGSRKMVGAMLTLAEKLDVDQAHQVLSEIEASLSHVFDVISDELDEPGGEVLIVATDQGVDYMEQMDDDPFKW